MKTLVEQDSIPGPFGLQKEHRLRGALFVAAACGSTAMEAKKREGRNLPDRLAPRLRAGSLPYGEARGGDFALSELPHPHHGLNLIANIRIFLK